MGRLAALPWAVALPLAFAVSCLGDEREGPPPAGKPIGNPSPNGQSSAPPSKAPAGRAEPALSGGTIAVSPDSRTAVISDPARGRVVLLDLTSDDVRDIPLDPADEPGRAAFDDAGRVHVVLRGKGAILSIDLEDATTRVSAVCAGPRGIAFDPATELLHTVTVLGDLCTVDPETGLVLRRVTLEPDLRDVAVRGDRLFVTTFRSATLLTVNAAGEIEGRTPAPAPPGFEANVAWRMAPFQDGVVVVHQASTNREIDVAQNPQPDGSAPYEASPEDPCDALVTSSVTIYEEQPDGTLLVRSRGLGGLSLPVDVAVSPDATELSIAASGAASVSRVDASAAMPGVVPCGTTEGVEILTVGDIVGTAYFDGGRLVQLREPDVVRMMWSSGSYRDIELGGENLNDTKKSGVDTSGYQLFHRGKVGPRAVTCASCHPEGRDDGHVWHFSGVGARRTQSLIGGISSTAPFHWSGDMADMNVLMKEVFEHRMGQVGVSSKEVEAMATWLDAQSALPSRPERQTLIDGRDAFEKAGCDECHGGDTFRSGGSYDVGTGGKFQVPSLLGVAARAPYMHDGCAPTLEARFDDPACGGTDHGDANVLDAKERAALIAYLRAL